MENIRIQPKIDNHSGNNHPRQHQVIKQGIIHLHKHTKTEQGQLAPASNIAGFECHNATPNSVNRFLISPAYHNRREREDCLNPAL